MPFCHMYSSIWFVVPACVIPLMSSVAMRICFRIGSFGWGSLLSRRPGGGLGSCCLRFDVITHLRLSLLWYFFFQLRCVFLFLWCDFRSLSFRCPGCGLVCLSWGEPRGGPAKPLDGICVIGTLVVTVVLWMLCLCSCIVATVVRWVLSLCWGTVRCAFKFSQYRSISCLKCATCVGCFPKQLVCNGPI